MTTLSKSASFKEQCTAYLKNIAVLFLFWMALFVIARGIFFIYHSEKVAGMGLWNISNAFTAGLSMDLSASTYLFALPMLLLFIGLWIDILLFTKGFLKWYGLAMISLISLITFTDIEIYSIWGYKANAEVLTYLAHPKEAMASSESSPLAPLILSLILFVALGWWLFRKHVITHISFPQIQGNLMNYVGRVVIIPITVGIAIIAIRGGVGLSNMGAGHAYHSQHQIMNHGATNASWNFLYSVQKMNSESPCQYHFMEEDRAAKLVNNILGQDSAADTIQILDQATPNVVLVVLEGWPVDVTGSYGGEVGVTPFFDSIAMEGIRFKNIYSSGDRTYKGVPAVLSGFPAFPSGSIIQYIQKMEQLPCIASSMKTKNYDTHFTYGGDIEFKSISSFITHCGYDKILSQDDFRAELAQGSKWGVHDHHVFERAAQEIASLRKPFFSTILTLSSHEPYDVPIPTQFSGENVSDQFRNSVYYADWSIRQFIEKVKDTDWFDNTVFVFTSDHGKPLPIKRQAWEHETFHIPALIYGNPIKSKYRGSIIDKIGSQLDIVKTLLDQLDIPTQEYKWSRNLLNPSTFPFAFYSFESGVGSVTANGDIVYDRVSNRLIEKTEDLISDSEKEQLTNLKAFLQSLCEDFDEL